MSSSIVKLLAVALEEAKKLEKQETERNSDSGGVQRTEEQLDQIFEEMGNMRIQFQDMKKEMEDFKTELSKTKIQLEESKIQLDETKIQLEESKIQLDESKILREDGMVQLEESKAKISELCETLKNIEELGKTNTKDILANSMNIAPLRKLIKYAKKPCLNCYGPAYCLNGKEVGTRPRNGTIIETKNKYVGKDRKGCLIEVPSHVTGHVYSRTISWELFTYETYDDADFCQFVYMCF